MPSNTYERANSIKSFISRWQEAEGNEERESRSFWIEFCQDVFNISNPTHLLNFERRVQGRSIDVFYEDMGILIEMKSRGVSLDTKSIRSKRAGEETPYQQAKWYADNLPHSIRPRWIIVCNFDEFRIHDLNEEYPETEYISVNLADLESQYYLFDFFKDKSASRLVKEQELSIKAAEIVGNLYKSLSTQYKNIETDKEEQRSLNILIVRLVFLLYAEDADILQSHQAFCNYMKKIPAERFRAGLISLFEVLNTPENLRDPYLDEDLNAFPYINGGLFAEEGIIIPQFTEQIRFELLKEASQDFDWSGISPTIFGAAFESTLNPETRREGGMHYTSIENIHKVIDPLFLDDLKQELAYIEGIKVTKTRKLQLKSFQQKLSSIKILDPACGSGNFLTESYLSLRKLENRVLENLLGDQTQLGFEGETNPIQVNINQFYGIEINDFAVSVAKTALWIAEEQMMDETQEILLQAFEFLPLKSNGNIIEGNALRLDWNDVLPADECIYIIGNPPFINSEITEEQKVDRQNIFGTGGGVLDYVACWYKKAADYMKDTHTKTAFVSTNSICQGQQVEPLWKPLFDDGIHIDFAYKTFVWNNEASNQAHVHVIIVGFSREQHFKKILFDSDKKIHPLNINGYLCDAESVFIKKISRPRCKVPAMIKGFQPTDNGNLILGDREAESLITNYINGWKFVRPFITAKEFINNKTRWCLWLKPEDENEYLEIADIKTRVEACREWRRSQKPTGDAYKLKEVPYSMRPCSKFVESDFIVVPRHSGEKRKYIPMGYIKKGAIPGDSVSIIPEASLYIFGVLLSQFHNAWMRVVCGRIKSDYRYASDIVYNNFPWPGVTKDILAQPVEDCVPIETRILIENYAQAILDVRDAHDGKSLADLYDPEKIPSDLKAAHEKLDAAVEAAYGVNFDGDEEKIVAYLFKKYAELTE
jgi:type I restriction-modification system DNA methylase subunit